MAQPPHRGPGDEPPQKLSVPHLTVVKRTGRPRKPTAPPDLDFGFTDDEQDRYDWFVQACKNDNQDLTPFDLLMLELAGVTYIKLLRMNAKEIADGQLITMARQNPSTDFTRYMDMLSTTRKQRQKNTPASDGDEKTEELLRVLSSGSR